MRTLILLLLFTSLSGIASTQTLKLIKSNSDTTVSTPKVRSFSVTTKPVWQLRSQNVEIFKDSIEALRSLAKSPSTSAYPLLELQLFNDTLFTVEIVKMKVTSTGILSIIGRIHNSVNSMATLSINADGF